LPSFPQYAGRWASSRRARGFFRAMTRITLPEYSCREGANATHEDGVCAERPSRVRFPFGVRRFIAAFVAFSAGERLVLCKCQEKWGQFPQRNHKARNHANSAWFKPILCLFFVFSFFRAFVIRKGVTVQDRPLRRAVAFPPKVANNHRAGPNRAKTLLFRLTFFAPKPHP
jgi:hypothetical protein